MSKPNRLDLRKRQRRIEHRLARRAWKEQPTPMLAARNIHYEVADKTRAVSCGGIGAIHTLVRRVGLARELDAGLHLLQRHVPHHESDHVLTLAYNVLCGGVRLEDIERLRQDEAWLDGLGVQRVPDPTTAGDFMRRFAKAVVGVTGLLKGLGYWVNRLLCTSRAQTFGIYSSTISTNLVMS